MDNRVRGVARVMSGVLVMLCLILVQSAARSDVGAQSPATGALGIAFIGSAEIGPQPQRLQHGVASGAAWDRWVLYWADIERSAGQLDWQRQDDMFVAEAASGLNINAVLLTTPDFYASGGVKGKAAPRVGDKRPLLEWQRVQAAGSVEAAPLGQCPGPANTYPPRSLNEAVFITQGGQRVVNPANHWARFVHAAVQRYKPGGELAIARGLPLTVGVRAWEIWNEPDVDCVHGPGGFGGFFNGTAAQYYTLLKVAYQVIKFADPTAQVVTGGLWFWPNQGWFDQFAGAIAADPDKDGLTRNAMYFDALGLHWYSNVRNTLAFSSLFAHKLSERGMPKPIWLTETGLPLIGDGIAPDNPRSPYAGTIEDQANYVIQNFALARWLTREVQPGIERVFHFQLYDDGIDGAFGAFGLIRNPAGPNPHPSQPGAPRPAYAAYQTAARYLDLAEPLSRDDRDGIERLVFRRPDGTRVTLVWNWNATDRTVQVAATAASALLVDKRGVAATVAPRNGAYTVALPAATNFNQIETPDVAMVGGAPYFLIESGQAPTTTATPTRTATPTATSTPAPTTTPPPGCANLVVNPGFETNEGWTLNRASRSSYQRLNGVYSLFVGLTSVPAETTWSSARQTVQLPAAASAITLAYSRALVAGDGAHQQIIEVRAAGATVTRVEGWSPATTSPGWESRRFDLTAVLQPHLGQPVELYFGTRNAAEAPAPAYMRVDDVALTACIGTTPTPGPTATAPMGVVSAQVRDAAGWAIDGAHVTLTADGVTRSGTTDALGRLDFADVPTSRLTLDASAPALGAWPARSATSPQQPIELRLPPAVSAVTNGGFDAGLTGWTPGGSITPLATGEGLSGAAVVLGRGFAPTPGEAGGNSTVSQTVVVTDSVGVGLGFAYRLATAERLRGADFFEVLVVNGSERTDVLDHVWHATGDWRYHWVDLSRWRGRTVSLVFNVYQSDGLRPTQLWLDEISIGVSRTFLTPYRIWLPGLCYECP